MVHAMAAATAVPHFHLCDDVQMDALIATRDTLRASMQDMQLSLLPLLIKTLSLALTQHPQVNAQLSQDLSCLKLIQCDPICPHVPQVQCSTAPYAITVLLGVR